MVEQPQPPNLSRQSQPQFSTDAEYKDYVQTLQKIIQQQLPAQEEK
jgi:hypothetical protein